MPTIPLYKHPAHPNGSHDVTSPGGYELWQFDAQDVEHDRVVIVRFSIGSVLPGYLERYRRYRRQPTRNAPPQPDEFVSTEMIVCDGGRRLPEVELFNQDWTASADRFDLRFGSNTVQANDAGELSLSVRVRSRASYLSANLTFTPRTPAFDLGERALFEESSTEGEHRWIIGAPLRDVAGEVRVERTSSPEQAFNLRGVGYHDHQYGTAPIACGLRGIFRGRALDPERNRCLAFQVARPRDERAADEYHLVEFAEGESRELEVEKVEVDWPGRRSHFGPPKSARFGDELTLNYAKGLAFTTTATQASYEARMNDRRLSVPALCEMIHPQRL